MPENQPCVIYLARHGETEWNVKGITIGQLDSPLTEKGTEQAERLHRLFKNIDFIQAYSSDLGRAQKTAEIILSGRNVPRSAHAELRERWYGTFEGKPWMENPAAFLQAMNEQKEIESDISMVKRMTLFLEKIGSDHPGKSILAVGHAGPIRSFLISIGGDKNVLAPGLFGHGDYVKILYDGKFLIEEIVNFKQSEK